MSKIEYNGIACLAYEASGEVVLNGVSAMSDMTGDFAGECADGDGWSCVGTVLTPVIGIPTIAGVSLASAGAGLVIDAAGVLVASWFGVVPCVVRVAVDAVSDLKR